MSGFSSISRSLANINEQLPWAENRENLMEEAKDTLKRLLNAEMRAQALVDQAIQERDKIIAQALADVQRAEERFAARIPEIQQSFITRAESQAEQAISELARRYEEREKQFDNLARERRDNARKAVLAGFLDPAAYP